ncbi:MAG TPA: response regulator [Syntrophobacteraceae bacterium]|nr:response regulator [Syntrophobacteraceae bacterium]
MSHSGKQEHARSGKACSKPRIFIVENEILIVRGLEEALEYLGYSVCGFAFSGEDAILLIERHKPDLVLVDIRLKGEMDGIELADKITSHHKIPVIYITAYSDRELLERAKVTDPSGFIVKPVGDRQLKANIELALERCRRDRERALALEPRRRTNEELRAQLSQKTAELEETMDALQCTKAELERNRAKLDELRLELQEVNKTLLNLTAHMARMREELEMEVAAALRMRVMPILRQLQSDPDYRKCRVELEMLAMHVDQLSGNLMKGPQISRVLSTTELRISGLIKHGLTSEEIASRLYLSLDTIKTHRRNIRKKLGIQNKDYKLSAHLRGLWASEQNN